MPQQPAPQPTPRVEAPAAPAIPGVTVVSTQVFTRQDVEALRARGSELSDQLISASGRRKATRDALKSATGADKVGLEQRLGVLDARIARLEQDIDENGKQLASVAARRAAITGQSGSGAGYNSNLDRLDRNMVPIAIVFTIFVLAPIALSVARMFWKRGSLPRQAVGPDHTARLERMEQAIDTIAIEMERVSEGQRFVTRLLSEARPGGSLGEGARAQPAEAALTDARRY